MSLKERWKQLVHSLYQHMAPHEKTIAPSLWNYSYEGDRLSIRGHAFEDLLNTWGSPLHVVDFKKLEDNYTAFAQSSSDLSLRCEIFASYKTNPVPGVLRHLHQLGAGAEVISEYELWLAQQLGVPANLIIYNGPAKSSSSLETAIRHGILSLNINHPEEIAPIQRIAQNLQKKVAVSVRVTLDTGWGGQLGIPAFEALDVYRQLLQKPEFRVVGVHCHRGATIRQAKELKSYLHSLLEFIRQLEALTGFHPDLLNIGGSLAIPTVACISPSEQRRAIRYGIPPSAPDSEQTLSPAAYTKIVRDLVTDHFRQRQRSIPRILLEPGRALTGNTQSLLCRVMSLRGGPFFSYAICDAGISLADSMRTDYHHIFPLKQSSHPMQLYRLVGPICHMGDTLRYALRLPRLSPGDGIAIMDAGAYFIPESRSFSFPQPGIIAIHQQGKISPLRRQESFADIIHRDLREDS